MATLAKKQVWACGDRYTLWTRIYTLVHRDGTKQVYTVDRVNLLHPRKYQVQNAEYGPRVIPRTHRLYNSRTKKAVKPRTHYYTFSESFFGGPSAQNDALGGFNSGHFDTVCRESTFRKAIQEIEEHGFVLCPDGGRS